LADRLAESLKRSGGSIRLHSPVLRLAYATDGAPIGVDLLSGERVIATRAIVSNLTIWDTYGKLIGISRTPQAISTQLKQASSWGAYLMFIGIDEQAANEIPSRLLLVNDSDSAVHDAPAARQLMLNCANADDARAPAGKRALTAWAFTHAEDWFSFHEDSSAHETRDQAELEKWWARLHSAMPELGDRAEVIETATPQTFYETTRRKFGMIGAPSAPFAGDALTRPFPNVFVVSDTASTGVGVEGVARLAVAVADEMTGPR
jgi:phytoene dehydrogenase-like protein